MEILKRMLSAVLALVLVVGMLPVNALATENETVGAGVPDGPLTAETEAVETVPETTAPEAFVEATAVAVDAAATSGSCGKNLTWSFDDATGTLTISGTGEMFTFYYMDDWVDNNCPWLHLKDLITTVVIESGVTTIGDDAFGGCRFLTDVYIPVTVTKIGSDAFNQYHCATAGSGLKVYYEGSEEQWASIDIWSEHTSLLRSCAKDYNTAFETTQPEAPLGGSFSDGLTWSLVDGLLAIGGEGTMTTYPGMGNTPWYDCREDITWIVIQDGVTNIGYAAFWGLSNLISVEIPNSVTVIGRDAFGQCTTLGSVEIPEGVTSIEMCAFSGCSSLKKVELPKTVNAIEKLAFENCFALESIAIPEGVTAIEECTFQGCYSLANLYIPASVESIGQNALACSYAFTNPKAQDIYFGGSEEQWDNISANAGLWSGAVVHFNSTGLGGEEVPPEETEPSEVLSGTCGKNAVWSFDAATGTLTISGEGEMADYDSWGNGQPWGNVRTDITNVIIMDGITSVGMQAFLNCENLRSVTIADSVQNIYERGFSWCESLKEIIIPDGVTYIGKYAFEGCTSLESLIIPVSVTSISYKAISICDNLKDIYYGGSQEQWEALINVYQNDIPETTVVHFNSTGPDDSETEIRVSYGAETTISTGSYSEVDKYFLRSYLTDWKDIYDDFIAKVDACLQEFGGLEEESKESVIRQETERMREHDKNESREKGRYLDYQVAGYESEAYHALATFFYENIRTEVPDLSSVDLSKDLAGLKLIEMIKANVKGCSKSYNYKNVTVSITAIGAMSGKFGTMTIEDNKGTPTRSDDVQRSVIVCSDTKEYEEAMKLFMVELQDLGLNSAFNIANMVYKDILGKSLTDLTGDYLSKKVSEIENKLGIVLREKLGEIGVGENLVKTLDQSKSTLDECYSFYTWAKKGIDFATEENISNVIENIKWLEFKDKSVSERPVKKAMSALSKANEKMQRAFREYVDGTIVEKEMGFWRTIFGCPVSISVYNSAGEQIGYVGEDDIWYTDAICITELGGVKEIVSFTEDELSFTVTATDYGTMSCMFEKFDENFSPVGRLNYYNVILEPEQTFQVSIPEDLTAETETAAITSGGETIYPDEYISAEDSAGVTISCDPVTEDGIVGGTVSGTGTYIRGDSVILRAEAYEGFRFVGWFEGEYLVCTEDIYEFPAREDCEVTARFYKEKPIVVEVEADIGGTAIGSSRFDSGETVTVIAIPASGYSFAGWYAGETLLSADAEYSFPASESLTLRAAFVQSEHPYNLGDVNHDGKINAKDATLILQKTVGVLKDSATFCETCADVSGDGKLNAKDSTLILQVVVGLRDSFPAKK